MDGDARFSRGSPRAAPVKSDKRESDEDRTNILFSEHKEDEGGRYERGYPGAGLDGHVDADELEACLTVLRLYLSTTRRDALRCTLGV